MICLKKNFRIAQRINKWYNLTSWANNFVHTDVPKEYNQCHVNERKKVGPRIIMWASIVICYSNTVSDMQPEMLITWVLFDEKLSTTLANHHEFRSLTIWYSMLVWNWIKHFLKSHHILYQLFTCYLEQLTSHAQTLINSKRQSERKKEKVCT